MWILLLTTFIVQNRIITVHNWIVQNYTDNDDETINFGDDDNDFNDEGNEEGDYVQEFLKKKSLDEKSRLLDFEENYVKPNIQHNLKLSDSVDLPRKKKRDLPSDESDVTLIIRTEKTTEPEYNYNQFKAEYDHDLEEMKKFQAKLNSSEFLLLPKSECGIERFFNKGPFTFICLVAELCHGETIKIRQDAKKNIAFLLKLWLFLIIMYFVVIWSIWGYLNFMCPFAMCFYEDVFEEVKQRLVMNPPGTKIEEIEPKHNDSEKTKIKQIYFEPTETEYYLYNSIWNDIYRD